MRKLLVLMGTGRTNVGPYSPGKYEEQSRGRVVRARAEMWVKYCCVSYTFVDAELIATNSARWRLCLRVTILFEMSR